MRRDRLIRTMAIALGSIAGVLGPADPPARACVWDYETYHAEAESLPCVFDALLGYWPKHTDRYHEVRLEATDYALRWVPGWAEGLDARGVSQMKLGRMDEAEVTMKQRFDLDPDAYAGHANLGTLYTFTGKLDTALTHIDRAMAIEPKAHFGREKYHRTLVVYLQRLATEPDLAKRENFLGFALTDEQRLKGSPEVFKSLGLDEDVFDALVSMITVYGAETVADVYFALGDVLAARGHRRLAYSAYRRAKEHRHPQRKKIGRWIVALEEATYRQYIADAKAGTIVSDSPPDEISRDTYVGLKSLYIKKRAKSRGFRQRYAKWEKRQIAKGLPIWTAEGLDRIYDRMNEDRYRCRSPGVIDDPLAPSGGGPPKAADDGAGDDANAEEGTR